MEGLCQIESLAKSANNYADARQLFESVNLNLFLRFEREFTGKTTKKGPKFINRVVAGELTTGSWPLPIEIYDGPTGREFLKPQENTPPESCSGGGSSFVSAEKNSSLGNVSREFRGSVELFLASGAEGGAPGPPLFWGACFLVCRLFSPCSPGLRGVLSRHSLRRYSACSAATRDVPLSFVEGTALCRLLYS